MTHICTDCGLEHGEPVPAEPEPVVVEPGPNENAVKIAEVEAAARIETERIYAGERDMELVAEVERLRGELAGVRETLATLAPPPPEPAAPVVVETPPAEPPPLDAAPPPPAESKAPKQKKGGGWQVGYG